MSRDVEVEALRHIVASYQFWGEAQKRLHAEMRVASDTGGLAPVAALQDDYAAQGELASAAVTFARSCAPSGPDVDGVAGPAFVVALFQAAAADGVEAELAEIDAAMADWWPELTAWTPDGGVPPPRPRTAVLDQIIDALTNWMEFLDDRESDQMAHGLAAQGAEVTRTFMRTPDGDVGSVTRADLSPPVRDNVDRRVPEAVGTVRRDGSVAAHLCGMWRAPLRVVSRSQAGGVDLLSTHWRARAAYRHAHSARLTIEPSGWIELWEWRLGGFELLDVLPRVDESHVTDDGREFVFGVLHRGEENPADGVATHTLGVIGAITPDLRGWSIMVRDPGTEEFWVPRLREYFYPTWADGVAGVQQVFDRQSRPQ